MKGAETSFAPGYESLSGQPQRFEPFPVELPRLGKAIVGPAEELATVLTIAENGRPQPGIIVAAALPGLPTLALMFRPTREQAARFAQTLQAFADGREDDLLKGLRS